MRIETSEQIEAARAQLLEALVNVESHLNQLDEQILHLKEEMREMNPSAKLYFKYVRCGKPGCRCNRGKKHGPYAYVSHRGADGKVHTVYCGKDPELPPNYIPQSVYQGFERRLVDLRAEREALMSRVDEALVTLTLD